MEKNNKNQPQAHGREKLQQEGHVKQRKGKRRPDLALEALVPAGPRLILNDLGQDTEREARDLENSKGRKEKQTVAGDSPETRLATVGPHWPRMSFSWPRTSFSWPMP